MDLIKECNAIMFKAIEEQKTPDLEAAALRMELYEVKSHSLDLSMRCENLMRKCTDQFQMIQDQQEVIDKLRRRLKDAGLS